MTRLLSIIGLPPLTSHRREWLGLIAVLPIGTALFMRGAGCPESAWGMALSPIFIFFARCRDEHYGNGAPLHWVRQGICVTVAVAIVLIAAL